MHSHTWNQQLSVSIKYRTKETFRFVTRGGEFGAPFGSLCLQHVFVKIELAGQWKQKNLEGVHGHQEEVKKVHVHPSFPHVKIPLRTQDAHPDQDIRDIPGRFPIGKNGDLGDHYHQAFSQFISLKTARSSDSSHSKTYHTRCF